MYNPLDLSGKLILLTGASSGIGRGTAVVLSKLGARLILTGRREPALQETRLMMDNPDIHLVEPFDLSNVGQIPAWVKEVVGRAGAPLNGLVHSAGVGTTVPIRAFTEKNLDEVLVPNLYAALSLLRGATAKSVMDEHGGSVVWISSAAGLQGAIGLVHYSASKGALISAARSAALELAPKRIRVNCVAPGYVETPMIQLAEDFLPKEAYERTVADHPLGIGKVEDVGHAVAYLLSDAARWVTGTTITLDGGKTA